MPKAQEMREKNSIKHVIGARKGMSKYAITAKEREWLENRDAIQFACDGYYYCGFHPEALDDDYKDAAGFEARAKVIALNTDISELPCVHGRKKCFLLKYPQLGCSNWCRLRMAHLQAEEEMDSEHS